MRRQTTTLLNVTISLGSALLVITGTLGRTIANTELYVCEEHEFTFPWSLPLDFQRSALSFYRISGVTVVDIFSKAPGEKELHITSQRFSVTDGKVNVGSVRPQDAGQYTLTQMQQSVTTHRQGFLNVIPAHDCPNELALKKVKFQIIFNIEHNSSIRSFDNSSKFHAVVPLRLTLLPEIPRAKPVVKCTVELQSVNSREVEYSYASCTDTIYLQGVANYTIIVTLSYAAIGSFSNSVTIIGHTGDIFYKPPDSPASAEPDAPNCDRQLAGTPPEWVACQGETVRFPWQLPANLTTVGVDVTRIVGTNLRTMLSKPPSVPFTQLQHSRSSRMGVSDGHVILTSPRPEDGGRYRLALSHDHHVPHPEVFLEVFPTHECPNMTEFRHFTPYILMDLASRDMLVYGSHIYVEANTSINLGVSVPAATPAVHCSILPQGDSGESLKENMVGRSCTRSLKPMSYGEIKVNIGLRYMENIYEEKTVKIHVVASLDKSKQHPEVTQPTVTTLITTPGEVFVSKTTHRVVQDERHDHSTGAGHFLSVDGLINISCCLLICIYTTFVCM